MQHQFIIEQFSGIKNDTSHITADVKTEISVVNAGEEKMKNNFEDKIESSTSTMTLRTCVPARKN
jgi:hypothetical protein